MKFDALNGDYFSFAINRYEFPNEELGPTDDNPAGEDFDTGRFLVISCEFRNGDGDWTASFPEMDTNGLARFIDWMDSINNNAVIEDGVHFIEYDLEFTTNDSRAILHVHAFNHFLPPWISPPASVKLDFAVTDIDFADALGSLRRMAEQFPGRPPRESAT